jgi:hypothetical protein
MQRIGPDTVEINVCTSNRLIAAPGFVAIGPNRESEIPDEHRAHGVFMERMLTT